MVQVGGTCSDCVKEIQIKREFVDNSGAESYAEYLRQYSDAETENVDQEQAHVDEQICSTSPCNTHSDKDGVYFKESIDSIRTMVLTILRERRKQTVPNNRNQDTTAEERLAASAEPDESLRDRDEEAKCENRFAELTREDWTTQMLFEWMQARMDRIEAKISNIGTTSKRPRRFWRFLTGAAVIIFAFLAVLLLASPQHRSAVTTGLQEWVPPIGGFRSRELEAALASEKKEHARTAAKLTALKDFNQEMYFELAYADVKMDQKWFKSWRDSGWQEATRSFMRILDFQRRRFLE